MQWKHSSVHHDDNLQFWCIYRIPYSTFTLTEQLEYEAQDFVWEEITNKEKLMQFVPSIISLLQNISIGFVVYLTFFLNSFFVFF